MNSQVKLHGLTFCLLHLLLNRGKHVSYLCPRCRALAGKCRNASQELHEFPGNQVGFLVAAQSGCSSVTFLGWQGDEENVEREKRLGFERCIHAGAWVWRSNIRTLFLPIQSWSYQRGWKVWRLMESQTQRSKSSTRATDERSRPKSMIIFCFQVLTSSWPLVIPGSMWDENKYLVCMGQELEDQVESARGAARTLKSRQQLRDYNLLDFFRWYVQLSQIKCGSNFRPSFSNSVAISRFWFLQGKKKRDQKAAKTGVETKEEDEDEEQTVTEICLWWVVCFHSICKRVAISNVSQLNSAAKEWWWSIDVCPGLRTAEGIGVEECNPPILAFIHIRLDGENLADCHVLGMACQLTL